MASRVRLSRAPLLVSLTALLVACGQAEPSDDAPASIAAAASTPASIAATPEPSDSAPDSPDAEPSAPASEGPVEEAVAWTLPFSITIPADWVSEAASPMTFNFRSGPDRWVAFTRVGPDTVDAWLEELGASDAYVLTDPAPVEVGAASGVVLDLELADGESEAGLFEEASWGHWAVSPDRPNRLWLLDVGGETVLIVTDAPERAFESWIAVVEEALATLEWEG
jgi:hypothetical protein